LYDSKDFKNLLAFQISDFVNDEGYFRNESLGTVTWKHKYITIRLLP